jgi:hypothetical protein
MVSIRSSLERDENGMTAVIEFLSAFTLFLMILTAFLSLAQLEMGSNDTSVDRLDRAAAQGIDRMTSDGGWFVPILMTDLMIIITRLLNGIYKQLKI